METDWQVYMFLPRLLVIKLHTTRRFNIASCRSTCHSSLLRPVSCRSCVIGGRQPFPWEPYGMSPWEHAVES
jgi:hypothetical protein